MKKKITVWFIFLILLIIMTCCLPYSRSLSASSDYWPTEGWRTSTPEEQGLDSQKLSSMLKIIQNTVDIHSIIIIRHGYMVLESYMAPYDRTTGHNLKSVSKSFLSAMVGIAIREKMLTGLDQKLVDILPEYFTGDDLRKKEITLRHLLTMTAGFKWAENTEISRKLWDSENWVKYAMGMPLTDNPGEKFNYDTALTHLMSAVITKVSGMSTQDFARKYLLNPLGIDIKFWRRDPQGIYFGGSELFLTPQDMAKFGYLYLKHGVCNGTSVVPEEWTEESVKPQVKTGGWGGFADYGYWWWLQNRSYSAEGWGGQRIVVSPEDDMVVVFTSANFNEPLHLYDYYIIPAVHQGKLPPNPKASAALNALVAELEHPKPAPVSKFPQIASRVSGRTFQMEPNNFGINTLRLDFGKSTECTLTLETNGGQVRFPIGLDNVYRVSKEGNELPMAFKGKWLGTSERADADTFLLEWMILGEPLKCEGKIVFDKTGVDVQIMIKPEYNWVNIKGEVQK